MAKIFVFRRWWSAERAREHLEVNPSSDFCGACLWHPCADRLSLVRSLRHERLAHLFELAGRSARAASRPANLLLGIGRLNDARLFSLGLRARALTCARRAHGG